MVGGGLEAVPAVRLAKSMGLWVVVSDVREDAPGFGWADDRLLVSTYDADATVVAAMHYHKNVRPIDAVMCIATDVPVTVARVASELGLPGIDVETAVLACDKLAMKRRFQDCGVPVPWFELVESAEHLKELVARHGYPMVIKPVDSRGARGVLRLLPQVDLAWAYRTSICHSPTGRVMVERFMSGPQVSTESLMVGGVAFTPGFADRNYEYLDRYSPYIIENGGELPSRLPTSIQEEVRGLVQKAAVCLGVHDGVVKGDIVVSDGDPYVIELAARLSGGYFCTHEIPLNTGVDFVGAAILQALGEEVDTSLLKPRMNHPVAQRYFFPEPGVIKSIADYSRYFDLPGVEFLEVRVQVGDRVVPVTSHPARAGVVITTAETVSGAVALAEDIVRDIEIETEAY